MPLSFLISWLLLDRAPYLSHLIHQVLGCYRPGRHVGLSLMSGVVFMLKLLSNLWADDGGFIISAEMLFIAVILVIGIIGGLAALRDAVATELASLGAATKNLDPGFDFVSVGSKTGSSNGTLVTHVNRGLD